MDTIRDARALPAYAQLSLCFEFRSCSLSYCWIVDNVPIYMCLFYDNGTTEHTDITKHTLISTYQAF